MIPPTNGQTLLVTTVERHLQLRVGGHLPQPVVERRTEQERRKVYLSTAIFLFAFKQAYSSFTTE